MRARRAAHTRATRGQSARVAQAARAARVAIAEAEALSTRLMGSPITEDLDLTIFATPGEEQWWGVELPSDEMRKATSVARWLAGALAALGPVGCAEAEAAAAEAEAAGKILPPMPNLPARTMQVWLPKKKIKAYSLATHKMGAKSIPYLDGRVVFFKAVLDGALASYVANSIYNMTSYDERVALTGRIVGWFRKRVVDGVQVPLPVEEEALADAREWEATPEVWDYEKVWVETNGPDMPVPPLPDEVVAAREAAAAAKTAKAAARAVGTKAAAAPAAKVEVAQAAAMLAAQRALVAAEEAQAVAPGLRPAKGGPYIPGPSPAAVAKEAWLRLEAAKRAAAAGGGEGEGEADDGEVPWFSDPALLVGWTVGPDPARLAEDEWGGGDDRRGGRRAGGGDGYGRDGDGAYAPRGPERPAEAHLLQAEFELVRTARPAPRRPRSPPACPVRTHAT